MTKDEIIAMARYAGIEKSNEYDHLVCTEVELMAFAKLIAERECGRIIAKNAPVIKKVNEHIKELQERRA
jgi:hypothetical protein